MSDLSQREKRAYVSFLVKNSDEFQSEVFKSIVRQFLSLQDEDKITQRAKELETIFYETLKSFYKVTKEGLSWRFSLVKDVETLRRKITELRVKSVKRKKYIPSKAKKKKDKLEPLVPILKSLREKGLSYYEIRDYLEKYHGVKVSESTIRKFMKSLSL